MVSVLIREILRKMIIVSILNALIIKGKHLATIISLWLANQPMMMMETKRINTNLKTRKYSGFTTAVQIIKTWDLKTISLKIIIKMGLNNIEHHILIKSKNKNLYQKTFQFDYNLM